MSFVVVVQCRHPTRLVMITICHSSKYYKKHRIVTLPQRTVRAIQDREGGGGGELFDSKGFLQFIPNGSMLFPHTTYNTVSKYLDRRRHSFIHSFAVISSSIIGARNHEHGTGVLDFGYLLLFVSPPFTGANIYFSVVIFRFDTIRHKN